MRPFSIALIATFYVAASATGFAQQFPDEHVVPAPTVPGPSALDETADAYMANNGYQPVPNLTQYRSVSGSSPNSDSVTLSPGRWAIAVLNWNGSTCGLQASYRDVGYTLGDEQQATYENGFQVIALNVRSSLSSIALTVRDASFAPGDSFSVCGYELRFYSAGSAEPENSQGDNPPPHPCRPCETWDEQQQQCRQWRACY